MLSIFFLLYFCNFTEITYNYGNYGFIFHSKDITFWSKSFLLFCATFWAYGGFNFFFTFGVLLIGNFQKAIIRNPITTFVMLFAKENCSNRKMISTTRYCFGTWRVLMNPGILNVPTVNHGNLEEVTLSGFGLRANFKKVLQVK